MNATAALVPWAASLLSNLLVFGCAIGLAIAVALRILPDANARLRHAIALLAFIAATLVPVLATSGMDTGIGRWVWSHAGSPGDEPTRAALRTGTRGMPGCPPAALPCTGVWTFDPTRVADSPIAAGALCLWTIGALLLVARDAAGHVAAARAKQHWPEAPSALRSALGLPDDVALYVHASAGPSAIGWWRPAIVLPSQLMDELPPRATAHMVRHELHHVRHRDPLINACVRFTRALLWPSAPLWYLERVLGTEREAAADQTALATWPPRFPTDERTTEYANVLFAVARWGRAHPIRGAWAVAATHVRGRSALEDRVARLLRPSTSRAQTRLASGLGFVLCSAIALTLVPVVRAGERLPASRVLFSPDGRAEWIRRTDVGEIAEAVLQRSEMALKASAIRQILPVLPDPADEPPTGGVFVLVFINERGEVMSARAVSGEGGPLMTTRVLEAVRQWTFAPAAAGAVPTKVVGELSFFTRFERPNPAGWRPLRK